MDSVAPPTRADMLQAHLPTQEGDAASQQGHVEDQLPSECADAAAMACGGTVPTGLNPAESVPGNVTGSSDADAVATLPDDAAQNFKNNAYDPFSEHGDHDWMLYEEEDDLFSGEPDAFFSDPGLIF